jgi:hypothetical protein
LEEKYKKMLHEVKEISEDKSHTIKKLKADLHNKDEKILILTKELHVARGNDHIDSTKIKIL